MKNYILFLCALATLAFASSCKSPTDYDVDRWNDKDTTSYPAPQELAGEWYLAYYETFGGMPDSVPFQKYMLNFATSKKVTGNVNCNTLTAEYVAGTTPVGNTQDKSLTFKNISTTKINCGTGDLDTKFSTALSAAKQYFVYGDMLEISYTGSNTAQAQRMIFKRKQLPNNDVDLLKGTEWTLVSFEHFGQPAEWIPVAFQADLNISFMGNSLAVGMAECGKFSAEYQTSDKRIGNTYDYPLGFTITNSVPCGGNYGSRFLEALKASKSYFRMGDSLEINYAINQGGTASRMMFVRKGTNWNPQDTITKTNTIIVTEIPTVNIPADQFIITNRYPIVNNILKLGVQFSGGCGLHEFNLFGKVSTGGVELLLTHDDNNDPCDALVNTDVEFDLTKFIEEYKKITGKQNGNLTLVMKSTGNGELHSFQFQF